MGYNYRIRLEIKNPSGGTSSVSEFLVPSKCLTDRTAAVLGATLGYLIDRRLDAFRRNANVVALRIGADLGSQPANKPTLQPVAKEPVVVKPASANTLRSSLKPTVKHPLIKLTKETKPASVPRKDLVALLEKFRKEGRVKA